MTNNKRPVLERPPLSSRILYLSESCVAVNKLTGEAVEGAGQGQVDLPAELAPLLPGGDLPAPVHRLDVPVSGCALFARTQEAMTVLSAAFAHNKMEKRYWAVVESPAGFSFPEAGELVHWLGFDKRHNKSFAHNSPGQGRKRAVLRYRLAGRGDKYLFFEVELFTGRHHQIRAQFAAAGLHIKGDLKYGAKRSDPGGGIRLHARSLVFPNPLTAGERISVQADPLPCDNLWRAFTEALS
jgi:23S rRNA pseudouridine1911/1915/1917 synthase